MSGRRWTIGYLTIAIAPLVVARIGTPGLDAFATELAIALGFLGFSLSILQFVLVSRIGPTSKTIGADRLLALHRGMGLVVVVFVVLHVALLVPTAPWRALRVWGGPPAWRPGAVALWALAVIVVTSIWRRRIHLSYESWQRIHFAGAVVLTLAAAWHAVRVRRYTADPVVTGAIGAYVLALAAFVGLHRIVRPWQLGRHPWRIVENEDAGGGARRLRLRPIGHRGLAFQAGQFAWLLTGRSPFWAERHPLSMAASPSPTGEIEFLVKALGDWSGVIVPRLHHGSTVWVDGPYGAFVPRAQDDEPIVLVAGGIGIAPMRAILQQLRDENRRRSVTLILGAAAPERIVAAGSVASLVQELGARFVPVFAKPPPGWEGERGFVTAELLRRHVTPPLDRAEFLICGPLAMIDAVTDALAALGVGEERIITERFEVV